MTTTHIGHATPYHFLLGGHDLEMLAIRGLLDREQQPYTDLGLGWGAKLSDYCEVISAHCGEAIHWVGV